MTTPRAWQRRINVYVDDDEYDRAAATAHADGRSLSGWVRRLVLEAIESAEIARAARAGYLRERAREARSVDSAS